MDRRTNAIGRKHTSVELELSMSELRGGPRSSSFTSDCVMLLFVMIGLVTCASRLMDHQTGGARRKRILSCRMTKRTWGPYYYMD